MVYVTHYSDEVLRLATYIADGSGSVIAQGGVGEMSLNPHLRSITWRALPRQQARANPTAGNAGMGPDEIRVVAGTFVYRAGLGSRQDGYVSRRCVMPTM